MPYKETESTEDFAALGDIPCLTRTRTIRLSGSAFARDTGVSIIEDMKSLELGSTGWRRPIREPPPFGTIKTYVSRSCHRILTRKKETPTPKESGVDDEDEDAVFSLLSDRINTNVKLKAQAGATSTLSLEESEQARALVRMSIDAPKDFERSQHYLSDVQPPFTLAHARKIDYTFDLLRRQREAAGRIRHLCDQIGYAMLCDDMGTDKTLTTVAALASTYGKVLSDGTGTVLIVTKAAVLQTWRDTLNKFLDPQPKIYMYQGVKASEKPTLWKELSTYHFVITTYETLAKDYQAVADQNDAIVLAQMGYDRKQVASKNPHETYTLEPVLGPLPYFPLLCQRYEALVCDEMHRIANMKSLSSRAVREVRARIKIGVSGSPFQKNNYISLAPLVAAAVPTASEDERTQQALARYLHQHTDTVQRQSFERSHPGRDFKDAYAGIDFEDSIHTFDLKYRDALNDRFLTESKHESVYSWDKSDRDGSEEGSDKDSGESPFEQNSEEGGLGIGVDIDIDEDLYVGGSLDFEEGLEAGCDLDLEDAPEGFDSDNSQWTLDNGHQAADPFESKSTHESASESGNDQDMKDAQFVVAAEGGAVAESGGEMSDKPAC